MCMHAHNLVMCPLHGLGFLVHEHVCEGTARETLHTIWGSIKMIIFQLKEKDTLEKDVQHTYATCIHVYTRVYIW